MNVAEMTGLDYLLAMGEGRLPMAPMGELMGMEPVEAQEGRVVFAAEPGPQHYNPIGLVHGGLAMTMLDSAMGCAVHTTLGPGVGYTSVETKVNFTRPITADTGRVLCEGTVINRGRTIALAEGKVYAADSGKLLAHGTSTCLIIQP